MKHLNKFNLVPVVLGVGGLLGVAAPAQADSTKVYTQTWSDLQSSSQVALSFNTFDTQLGTLDSVSIGGDVTINGELSILNLVASPESFTNGFLSEPVSVTGPFVESINQTAAVNNITGVANAGPGTVTNFIGCTNTLALAPATISPSEFGTFELSPFNQVFTVVINVGTGSATEGATFPYAPADVVIDGYTLPSISSGGSATLSGDLSVTYTYSNDSGPGSSDSGSAVPEPATASVIVLSSAAAAGVLLRRSRRANQL